MTDDTAKLSDRAFTTSLGAGDDGIFVAIGSNLPISRGGSPLESCERALLDLAREPVRILARSRWYRSAPVPAADQPDFVNGVARIATALPPCRLLATLHEVEHRLGRRRRARNEAREIDLDLIAYGRLCRSPGRSGGGPVLPHPRLGERAFVLLPLAELAPGWRHPGSGRTVSELVAALPPGQRCTPLAPAPTGGPDVIDFT